MIGVEDSVVLVCSLAGIQIVGLASAAVARLSEGSSRQKSGQRLFLACLGLVGAATIVSVFMGPGCWLSSGTTFSLMVLGATCDFSYSRKAPSF
jgi:hypothetical protein